MLNNKIMIITDSVSMPRAGIPYEETWIYMLKKTMHNYDVMDRSARGSTSNRLVTEGGGGTDLLETYMPRAVIMQLGITDCAPRLFRKGGAEKYLLNKIIPKKLVPAYIDYVKRKRGRNPDFTDVSPEQYRFNLDNFAARTSAIKANLFIIKILKPSELYISRSPGIIKNTDMYNRIAEDVAGCYDNVFTIDPAENIDKTDWICIDELHINSRGHEIYYNKIIEALTGVLLI